MKKLFLSISIYLLIWASIFAQSFTMEQVSSFSFPSELVTSNTGNRMAWTMNEKGLRNVYVAQAPDFSPRKVTTFDKDDGQEISSLQFSPDGNWLLFVRGGEHGSNWDTNVGFNPAQSTLMPKVELWTVSTGGGDAKALTEGDYPTISPDSKTITYIKGGQVWSISPQDGKASQLFEAKGNIHSLEWSPDGKKLLFVANRSTHSLIGIFSGASNPIQWIAPSFSRDVSPRWSTDGAKIAFVRLHGGKGEALPLLEQRHSPWEIWVADANSGTATKSWKAPETLRGSVPTTNGGFNLNWAADNKIVYLSYEDGWPHLYSIDAASGQSKQLTKGNYMVEHIRLSPDKKFLVFSTNTGSTKEDIDRRHIGMVSANGGEMKLLTEGEGIEAIPAVFSDNKSVAYFSANAKRPLLPAVVDIQSKKSKFLAENLVPADFPSKNLVVPKQVTFKSPDGLTVHGQLFEKEGGPAKKAAVLFVHGGPQRQMLLGWSYMDYYSNTYAVNQYLAELGFVVLSVNFRLGIGYGYEFHKPARTYWQGAEEYLDVKAAGEYLAGLPQVDAERIGIYGGSYGGYLTALALGKDSGLFKVGVDIHGVHNLSGRLEMPEGYEKASDFDEAVKIAWFSSPLAYIQTWTSPVLFIHGDDDRNVQVSQTTDLIRRFEERKKPYEYLIIPGDSHHWMIFSNMVKVNQATADFLKKHLNP
ncbi:prolyl oligopeptidase family serine peptidase [Aquiflexum sp. TKW24L]|uniref:S9 family peptidase n=1 Tax=Aquiflexum sp. TKW24L TaxID=2942212 RepID=UPI0020C03FC4|nr:prolyl oligopeptidase family serine peptidase [Aquiflexum sp. TKW24L]MCL6260994.1 prolyl oligopeptidase family serine peptidase [Aquiflexum sp. TKW24L]